LKTEASDMKKMEKEIARIAEDILRIETLETRRSDELDFYDRAVWSIKAALEGAYRAGQKDGRTQK